MFDELHKRIGELRQREEDVHRRALTIFWFISQHDKAEMILPSEREYLTGWEKDEEDLLVYLGQLNYSFRELEDKVNSCNSELLVTITTALQMRLGACEVTRDVVNTMLLDGSEDEEEIRFPMPEEIINMTEDLSLLFAFALHGMNTIANEDPIPFVVIQTLSQNKDACPHFQEWMLPSLDALHNRYLSLHQ